MDFHLGQDVIVFDGSLAHEERGVIVARLPDVSGHVIYSVRLYDDGTTHSTMSTEMRPLLIRNVNPS